MTSHRIRTGIGDDWMLNREKVEDLLLRQGVDLPLDGNTPLAPFLTEGSVNSLAQLSIPPHTVARSERFFRLEQPAIVINFQPHMHFRGSRMLLEAIHADGRREVLTDVPRYEQVWQLTYTYEEPHLFPTGTVLHSVAWHDNTAANKHQSGPLGLDRVGQPHHGRHGQCLDGHGVHDRGAVSGTAEREAGPTGEPDERPVSRLRAAESRHFGSTALLGPPNPIEERFPPRPLLVVCTGCAGG